VVDILEPEGYAEYGDGDFSQMTYTTAFDNLFDIMRVEYAFTDIKEIDWDALYDTIYPRIEAAQEADDAEAFLLAMQDFAWAIPDGHVSVTAPFLDEYFEEQTGGGLGMALTELDDGRVLVTEVFPDSPAVAAGIMVDAEILAVDGVEVTEAILATNGWYSFSTKHDRRVEQVRFLLRRSVGTQVTLDYQNPGKAPASTTLTTVAEVESRDAGVGGGLSGFDLPVQYRQLESGYIYVAIYNFNDPLPLFLGIWEHMLRYANENNAPGIIIDMRNNGGGYSKWGDTLVSYFFDETLVTGSEAFYDYASETFTIAAADQNRLYLPPEDLRYHGPLAVLVGRTCYSACEFFTYILTLEERATVIGHYPTGGLGGSVAFYTLPENAGFQFTVGRATDPQGRIHIEGQGVAPDIRVPINEQTVFGSEDAVLDAAVEYLDSVTGG
jgi:C-terminal processing protease CtpA/Prc